ncbi:hypothetical protein Tco_1423497 [Tanacetum coccineum]
MHDAGLGMSKANPAQIGKFILEDGKVLTLLRKSSPSRNCNNNPGAACACHVAIPTTVAELQEAAIFVYIGN